MTRSSLRRACGLVWVIVASPALAWACPVCMAARDEAERLALIGTTVFLTSLPVIMISAIIIWVVRRTREVETADSEDAPLADDAADRAAPARVLPLRRPQP